MALKVPTPLRSYTRGDVASQSESWTARKWAVAFTNREDVFDAGSAHARENGGIRRRFVHEYANRHDDAVAIFLMAMAWGFAEVGYGPYRTTAMLAQEDAEYKLNHIVSETRDKGALAGWTALLSTHWIKGMNISFGTKLLYFAGYGSTLRPRPLILDDRVRWSLYDLARGTVVPPGTAKVTKDQYLRYLDLAEEWAADPSWNQEPEVVEFGLFDLNGRYGDPVVIPPTR